MRPTPSAVAAVAAVVCAVSAPAAQGQSSFAQLTGTRGCVAQALPDTEYGDACADGHGLLQAAGVAVSPDQANVYVASAGTARAGSNAVAAFTRDPRTGELSQLGCVSDDGGDGRPGSDGLCADGDALGGASDVAVSPDGASVYVASASSSGVAWFDRDPATGALTQAGCVKEAPRADRCTRAEGLTGADAVAVSPDGTSVYVAAGVSDAVVAFARDPRTGALTDVGCVSATGTDGLCTDGTALQGASGVAVSPDGAFVYVTASGISAITTYARDPGTGALTPAGCILDVAPKGGACKGATALAGAADVALSPDGSTAYVAAADTSALLTFSRDADTGALEQTGCLQNAYPSGDDAVNPDDYADDSPDATDAQSGCQDAKALDTVEEVTVSADGRSVFTADSGQLAVFDRDPETGRLTQTGCAEEDPSYKSCSGAIGLYGARAIASSGDGRNLYVAADNAGTVSVFGAAVAITTRAARVRAGAARIELACPRVRGPRGCAGAIRLAGASRRYALEGGRRRSYALRVHRRRGVVSARATDARHLTRATTRRIRLRGW